MRLAVLADNNTLIDRYYLGEPAVCYYVEDGDSRILFDAGYSDIFLKNAKTHRIDLAALSHVVLSHGHDDHTRGLQYLPGCTRAKNVELVAHPGIFADRWEDGVSFGCPVGREFLESHFHLSLTRAPYAIGENFLFLGEVPPDKEFERSAPAGLTWKDGEAVPDFVPDDSALVYKGAQGLFIISGCSHSGICNIIEYAKKLCGTNLVQGVLGGFHLLRDDEQVRKTVDYFEENNIRNIYPCHCVSFAAKAAIHRRIPVPEIGVGFEISVV